MKTHPVADLFPMLPDDELADLAADIEANGLQQPIVIKDKLLIDGRNRLAACEMAGVKPTFMELDGQDPVAFILSANLARRHMTAGQKAIAAARTVQFQFGTEKQELSRVVGVPKSRITEATQILVYAPDLADQVLIGATPFSVALEEAHNRKQTAESSEARLVALRAEAPDLADQVVDEQNPLTLKEAEAANKTRREEAEAKAKRVSESLRVAVGTLTKAFGTDKLRDQAVALYVDAKTGSELNQNITAEDLRIAAKVCNDLADRWEKK